MVAKLSDVAELAGVSVATVSRVINSYGPISQKTKDKVHAAMRQLHYQPNAMARSLQGKSSQFIGVILPTIDNPFFGVLAGALEKALFERGYKVIIASSANNVEVERQYLQMLAANQVEAIITGSHNLGIEEYEDASLPIVAFDRHLSDDIPTVSSDNYHGGELAAQYLLNQQVHKPLVIRDDDNSNSPTVKRGQGFVNYMTRHNVQALRYEVSDKLSIQQADVEKIKQFVLDNQIDGIFANNDLTAIMLKNVLPNLPIVGYDGTPLLTLLHPDLVTIVQPVDEIVKKLVEIMLVKIGENSAEITTDNIVSVSLKYK